MDYGTRIADGNQQIAQSQDAYNKTYGQSQGAYGDVQSGMGSAQNYGDIYNQARNQFMGTDEMKAADSANKNARTAIDQTNTTINKLPESIRQQYGGTGLTEAQRQRAMSTQMNDMQNTYNMQSNTYANTQNDYNSMMGRAMQETGQMAQGNYQGQQDKLANQMNIWSTLLGQSNNEYGQILSNRGLLQDTYGQKQQGEQADAQLAFNRWAKEQDLQRSRESEQSQLNMQKYLDNQASARATSQNALQQQMLEKQNRAGYNAYNKEQNNALNNQFQKDNSLWNNALNMFNSGYGDSIVNKQSQARNNIMTYDQYIGAK